MALGLPVSSGGGDRIPYIKYNGKSGRIDRVDRFQNAGGDWSSEEVEITDGFQAVFDMENIEVGWISFDGVPDFRMVRLGQAFPDKPTAKHKAGFRVRMKLGKSVSQTPEGDIRELSGNAGVAIAGMDKLSDAFLKGGGDKGQLPVVKLAKTIKVTAQFKDENGKQQTSTSYEPVWEIVKWVDRPPELVGGAPANEAKSEPVAQAKTPSQVAPEPAPAEDEAEF